jgi:transcription initiation factor TFIIIB Brf1 subunit/transcription initiation factor TFIIB
MVQDRPFDSKVEYRMFSNDDRAGGTDPTRIGAPQDPTLPQSSLSTVILNGSGYGKRSNKDMFRIRRYHSWNTIPYKERALIQAYDRLSLISSNNGINHAIIDTAKTLYVNVKNVAGRNGVSRDAMLSACVYTALKDSGTPRKPKDIAQMFGITTTVFTKAIKKLQTILMMARQKGKISISMAKKLEGTTTKASEYMLLPLSKLGIPKQDQELIYQMGLIVSEHIDGMTFCQENMPPSLAGGCLAFVIDKVKDELITKMDITHAMIADVCEISVATLQKCLKRIQENTGEFAGEFAGELAGESSDE